MMDRSAQSYWGFAGSYPLSELLGGVGSDLFELEDDNLLEYRRWSDQITDMVVEKVRSRAWDEDQVALLVGARREMIALDDESDRDEENGGRDNRGEASFSDE